MEDTTRMKVQEWAKENAYMLIFMSIGFALTIAAVIAVGCWSVAHGG